MCGGGGGGVAHITLDLNTVDDCVYLSPYMYMYISPPPPLSPSLPSFFSFPLLQGNYGGGLEPEQWAWRPMPYWGQPAILCGKRLLFLTHSLTDPPNSLHSLPPLSPSNRYKQLFDIEGESGVVVRGIGTCVGLIPKPPSLSVPVPICFPANVEVVRPASTQGDRSVPVMCMLFYIYYMYNN